MPISRLVPVFCYDQNLTADGKIYSVREQIEAVGFWYNEALFKQAGAKVPAEWNTWADFEDAVKLLVDAGITPFRIERRLAHQHSDRRPLPGRCRYSRFLCEGRGCYVL